MPFVSDTFTNTNGTLLENHTPEVGGAWEKLDTNYQGDAHGSAAIRNNGLEDRSDMYRNATDPSSNNIVVEMDAVLWQEGGNQNSSNSYAKILARMTPSVTAFGDVDCYVLGVSGNLNNFIGRGPAIARLSGGILTYLGGVDSIEWNDGQVYTFRAEIEDEGDDVRLRLYLDDALLVDVLDTSPITQTGRVGVNVGREGSRIENFAASSLGADVFDPANFSVTIDGTTAQLSWDASPLFT